MPPKTTSMESSLDTKSSAQAFGLVLAAAAATAIGSAVVFVPRWIRLANRSSLAACLSLGAGVMLYVGLREIYGKSIAGFQGQGHDEDQSFNYATFCFFAGLILMKILNRGIKLLLHGERMPDEETFTPPDDVAVTTESGPSTEEVVTIQLERDTSCDNSGKNTRPRRDGADANTNEEDSSREQSDKRKLFSMGVATAVAIALHNLPEGLITFVAYVNDKAVGVALAIGIAIHNIPEGLCVSVPIFYATGNRCQAFLWGLLSGVSEPIGALIGWLVLKDSFSGNTYGVLFGLVAGIMIYISIDELLPTAWKHDPQDRVSSVFVYLGMLIIAASLMLFNGAQPD